MAAGERLTPRERIDAECARRGKAALVAGCVALLRGPLRWAEMSSGETLVIASAFHDHRDRPHRQAIAMAPDPDPGIDGGEFLGWRQVETLGVADVVMSILEARKEMPWASAAAVSRQHHDSAIYVQVSLFERSSSSPGSGPDHQDGRIQLIAGFAARRLGEELVTAFGDKDVIILT